MLRADDRGFVLPVALVVMVLLSMMAAAGVYSSRTDLRAAFATREAAVALAAADAGAARTVALWSLMVPSLPVPGDSVIVGWQTLPDGSSYRSAVHRPPVDPAGIPSNTVILVTTGQVPLPGNARRTVATLVEATVGFGPICCDSGMKVSSRMRISGGVRGDPIPEIDGTDRSPPGWPGSFCPMPPQDIPGIVTSRARDIDQRRDGDVDGAPPILEDPSVTPADFLDLGGGTYADLAASADISFVGNQRFRGEIGPVVTGGVCDTTVPTNWGSPLSPAGPCGSHFPIIHVAGRLQLQRTGAGQGVLLVDGDLSIEDDFAFYGIIIVLGTVSMSDNARVFGSVLARGDADGRGRSQVQDEAKVLYSSCAVQRAESSLGGGGGSVANYWFEVIG